MAKPQKRRRKVPPAPAAAVRALRESETRYRVLAEQSSLGIVIHKDFIIRYANPALVTLFGYGSHRAGSEGRPRALRSTARRGLRHRPAAR